MACPTRLRVLRALPAAAAAVAAAAVALAAAAAVVRAVGKDLLLRTGAVLIIAPFLLKKLHNLP